jgi:hypothetical protein
MITPTAKFNDYLMSGVVIITTPAKFNDYLMSKT